MVALATAILKVVWVVDFDDDEECTHLAALPATVRATLAVTALRRRRHGDIDDEGVPAAKLAAARGVGWLGVDRFGCDKEMPSRCDIVDVAPLAECRLVILVLCSAVADYSPLCTVRTVIIEECSGSEDMGALNGVQDLTVTATQGSIFNVSALRSPRRLCLRNFNLYAMPTWNDADLAEDEAQLLKALGRVPDLELGGCPGLDPDTFAQCLGRVQRRTLCCFNELTDVSSLGTVHTLVLEECESLTDVAALGSVHTLTTRCCPISDVSALATVHTLTLESLYNVTDVSALATVHTLALLFCRGVMDVSALGAVHTIDLTGCENVTDVSALGGVHTLNLNYCTSAVCVA